MRGLVFILIPLTLCGCPQQALRAPATAPQAASESALAWLDPQARISASPRFTAPLGTSIPQAAYWQPLHGTVPGELGVILCTRDTSKRVEGQPDPEQVETLDLQTGKAAAPDSQPTGLPFDLRVSANHRYAIISALEPQKSGGFGLQAVDLLCYGYGEQPQVLRPEPSVTCWKVLDDGDGLCRIVKSTSISGGLPAVVHDWAAGLQRCNVAAKGFRPTALAALPSPDGQQRSGYTASYDPALPSRARIDYAQTGHGQRILSLPYFPGASGLEWEPPLAWLANGALATVSYLPGKSGSTGYFRIVTLETVRGVQLSPHLIEDHLDSGMTFTAVPGALLYVLHEADGWAVWAASPDGMQKQRLWADSGLTDLRVLDSAQAGRRILLSRDLPASEDSPAKAQLIELSLDPLGATVGAEELKPLPMPAGQEQQAAPLPTKVKRKAKPVPPAQGGGEFIPDQPPASRTEPPPIAPP